MALVLIPATDYVVTKPGAALVKAIGNGPGAWRAQRMELPQGALITYLGPTNTPLYGGDVEAHLFSFESGGFHEPGIYFEGVFEPNTYGLPFAAFLEAY